jgi:hypothetical protein
MGYSYRPEFSPAARARVAAVKIQAGLELDDAKQRHRGISEVEAEVRKYILRVFAAFAKEALHLGVEGLWTIEQIDAKSVTLKRQRPIPHDLMLYK